MKNNMFVTRSFDVNDFEVKEDEHKVSGHAAVFGQKTNIANCFYEIIERGAFDGCDLNDVMLLVNHVSDKIPLARAKNTNSTMKVNIDEKGLAIDASLDVEGNTESKSVYSAIKRGDMDGMSFAFFIQEQKWENLDTKMPTRRILKIKKVTEVSIVNRPAYSETDINARSEDVSYAKEEIQMARGNFSGIGNKLELEKLRIKILNL